MLQRPSPSPHDSYAAAMTMLPDDPQRYGTATLRQLEELRNNWIACRSLRKAFRHEEYLCWARVDVYAAAKDPWGLLNERIGFLVSQEYQKWRPQIAGREKILV